MIAEEHAALPLVGVTRSDKESLRDLNFSRTQDRRDLAQGGPVEDIAAFYAHDLAGLEFLDRKESAPLNRAIFDCGFRGEIGEWRHVFLQKVSIADPKG